MEQSQRRGHEEGHNRLEETRKGFRATNAGVFWKLEDQETASPPEKVPTP